MKATVLRGDCVEVMAEMPEASFDSIVTDPPYELLSGSRNGSGRSNEPDNPFGRHGSKGGGFMGLAWDASGVAFDPETWRVALRVLKPGGHLVAFGGTRTYHRLTCAVEDAGFEIRDTLCWLYGVGFPKSLDVSKAIDKAAVAERTVVGPSRRHGGGTNGVYAQDAWTQVHHGDTPDITAPTTAAACKWQGFGTALKPAWEPIVLARKPLGGRNVADNVLRYGTGAMNIDGCRIAHAEPDEHADRHTGKFSGATYADDSVSTAMPGTTRVGPAPLGRWPANVILTHSAGCRAVGTKQVHGSRIDKPAEPTPHSGYRAGLNGVRPGRGHGDPDGMETVEAYECEPDCPARLLDEQSGQTMSAGGDGASAGGLGDTGGASRFYYTSKASSAERTERTRPAGVEAIHPTVKPLDLMRWLCRLVCRPGGHILDPFAGSGTTLVAALQEGFEATGIEQSAEYIPIIQARINGVQLGGLFDVL